MKKPVMLSLIASLVVLAALGVGLVSAQEPITLVYWSMWNETEGQARVIQSAIEKFEAENPHITIEAV